MLQLLLRMKLQLKDGDTDFTSSATDATLTIDSDHTLYYGYNYTTDTWMNNDGIITFKGINLSASNGEVYLALPVGNAHSSMSRFDITVTAGGKTFRGYKDKTGSGFVNGNFYNMSGTLTLSSKVMPTMTNHNSNTPRYSSEYSYYYWDTYTGAADVTIGGASLGYGFDFESGGQVTLSMVNANTSGGPSNFIRVFSSDLEVNLEGDNYLICPGDGYCIYNGDNNVILGTTSTTPLKLVLRSTGNGNAHKGFHTAARVVAATGCTVTPPADDAYMDNGDGTYTWTWTVKKD